MKKELSLENEVVPVLRIRSKSIFNLQDLYDDAIGFLYSHKYFVVQKGQTEKTKSDGKEIETEWNSNRRIDDYIKFWIKIQFLFLRTNNVIVEENGKKIKKQIADVDIRLNSYLQKDYYNKFKNREFIKVLYEKYIIKKRIKGYEEKLRKETYEIYNIIKEHLKHLGKLKT